MHTQAAAGAVSSLLVTPVELIMISQQRYGGSFLSATGTIRSVSPTHAHVHGIHTAMYCADNVRSTQVLVHAKHHGSGIKRSCLYSCLRNVFRASTSAPYLPRE